MFTWWSIISSRIHAMFSRSRLDADFDQEVQEHLGLLIAENIERGMTQEEAYRVARIRLGGVTQLKESRRERRGLPRIDNFLKDLRYASRMLARSPGFTAVAVLTLALGIGLNTTLFTAIDAVAMRPLPVKDGGNLVRVVQWFESGGRGNGQYAFSNSEYISLRDHNRSLANLIAVSFSLPALAELPGQSTFQAQGQLVSGNYFPDLGVNAMLGRTFLQEETQPVIVLSHPFWQRAFNDDPQVLGKTVVLNGVPHTIAGVMPAEFLGTANPPQVPDYWAPLATRPSDVRNLQLLARPRPGIPLSRSEADIAVLSRQFTRTNTPDDRIIQITLEQATLFGGTNDVRFRALVALLMAVVGMVLLIACANLANMLLARAGGRQREIAVRLALGAGRGRVIRQLLTESMLLGLLGGAAGLLLSIWASKVLWALMSPAIQGSFYGSMAFVVPMFPDVRVFFYTLLLALITGVIFGLAPALQLSKPIGQRLTRARPRRILIAVQVAASMALLICAGLMMRGVFQSRAVSPGFETRNVFMVLFDRGPSRPAKLPSRIAARLRELPEVAGAALVDRFPLTGTWSPPMFVGSDSGRTLANYVSPEYFETLGVPIVAGRNFTEQESARGTPVAIISEAAAQRFWPRANPLGKRFKLDTDFRGHLEEFQVIGVAKDVRTAQLSRIDPAYVYLTDGAVLNNFLVRTRGATKNAQAAIRAVLEGVEQRLLPSLSMISLEDGPLRQQRTVSETYASLAAMLAGLALALVAAGIYGVMAYMVSQRVREIGIRMALGASAPHVLRLVVGRGLRPVFFGAAAGLAGAAALSGFLREMMSSPGTLDLLYGVSPFDPLTFIGLACFMTAVALIASWIPARRAVRVDPVSTLRCD